MNTEIVNANEITLDTDKLSTIKGIAKIMASSTVTVPKHLRGSESDCFAICLQAAQWGMSPFVVAQKTHLINGVLGYESQLINAVIANSGLISGSFLYEFKNDPAACRIGAFMHGQEDVTWGEWLTVDDVTTKNSPLWKSNPKQQLAYLQVKNFARLYAPGAILGVYSTDELKDAQLERDITPPDEIVTPQRNTIDIDQLTLPEVEPAPAPTYAQVADMINNAQTKDESKAALEMSPDHFFEELKDLHMAKWKGVHDETA